MMMSCNWMVVQAIADRKALRNYGVPAEEVRAMDHAEVVKALKARGYNWKAQPKRNNHGCL